MPKRPPIWDRPRIGYLVGLAMALFAWAGTLRQEVTTLQHEAAAQDRETADVRARIASLEAYARNCKP